MFDQGSHNDGGSIDLERQRHKIAGARRLRLEHTVVALQRSPAGPVARIERGEGVEWAGPVAQGTVDALCEVAGNE